MFSMRVPALRATARALHSLPRVLAAQGPADAEVLHPAGGAAPEFVMDAPPPRESERIGPCRVPRRPSPH